MENKPIVGTASGLPRLAYTMEETAEILGVSYISIHRLLKRGLLKSSTALRHKLIPKTETRGQAICFVDMQQSKSLQHMA